MENKMFPDYEIAEITNKDQVEITKLEKAITSESTKNIVLIAYQPKDKAED
jgi:hypothetical protein